MVDLLKFIFNKKILSKVVVLGYNQICSSTLSFYLSFYVVTNNN